MARAYIRCERRRRRRRKENRKRRNRTRRKRSEFFHIESSQQWETGPLAMIQLLLCALDQQREAEPLEIVDSASPFNFSFAL